MPPIFCPPTIWAISLEFCRKPYILEADDFLGACYRKAMTQKAMDFAFPQAVGIDVTLFGGFRFPRFFRFAVFLAVRSCSLFQGFEGFCREENPCFFRGSSLFFAKMSRIGGSGYFRCWLRKAAPRTFRWWTFAFLPPPPSVKNSVDFWWQIFFHIFPRKMA